MDGGDRLPTVPRIFSILIEAELDSGLGFIRGEATSAEIRPQEGQDPSHSSIEVDKMELHSETAQIHRPFGREFYHNGKVPQMAFIAEDCDSRGWHRLSRLRSNPRFVLYREDLDRVTMKVECDLQRWTRGKTCRVFSQIAPYPLVVDKTLWSATEKCAEYASAA